MSASYNRVILMGNLTRDPELTYTPSNVPVCKFGLATNRKWRDRDGNQKEDVCFVDLTAWGKSGEIINQYKRKGDSIHVEGRLQFRQWTDKEGKNRSKLDVVVENFTFVGGPRDRQGGEEGGHSGGQRGGYSRGPAPAAAPARPAPEPAGMDEPPPMEEAPPPSEPDMKF